MQLSTGKVLTGLDVAILNSMAEFGFVQYREEPFDLKSGVKSNVYVFGREDLTDNPGLLILLGEKIASVVWENSPTWLEDNTPTPCLIGLPTAGTPLSQAASMVASLGNTRDRWRRQLDKLLAPISFRIMREQKKTHGAHNTWVNGKPNQPKPSTIWIVDNVATDGQTKKEMGDKLGEDGYPSRPPCIIVVDRCQGALSNLAKWGFERVYVLYTLLEIVEYFSNIKAWPESAVESVRREIEEHQLKIA